MREDFLQYLQLEKRYSAHTVKSYQVDLLQAEAFLNTNYAKSDISLFTHDELRSWMVHLIDTEISPRTVNRKMSAIKSFFKWAKVFRNVQADPTKQLVMPKVAKRLPVYLEEDQMEQVLDSRIFPDTFEGHRNRLIIDLFYQTGIRSSELIALKETNVDFQRKTIKVLGKRNKERIVPVGDEIILAVRTYQNAKAELETLDYHAQLFVTSKGKSMYPKLVYRVVNNYLGEVSTLHKKSPHVLRHTFATHMLNRGADLNAIKELLGHASLAATQVYTHNSIEKLKDIHRNTHPNG